MRRTLFTIALAAVCLTLAFAQKTYKPASEWSAKEAQKMLNESPWGQTQTETDTSEMFFNPTTQTGGGNSNARVEEGARNQPLSVKYRIRFLSARPIREAIARSVELSQSAPNPQLSEQLKRFVESTFGEHIVVAVTFEASDGRASGPALQAFSSASPGTLKNTTYLERKDGRRLFLTDYQPPARDGLGAKFVFPRNLEGEPFLNPESGTVRFYSELGQRLKLNMRYKLADMQYNGRLEY